MSIGTLTEHVEFQHEPPLAIDVVATPEAPTPVIDRIYIGAGRIAVSGGEAVLPSDRQLLCAQLASIGLDDRTIGDYMNISIMTVNKHLGGAFAALHVLSRTAVGQRLIDSGVYTFTEPAQPLQLTPRERLVVTGIAAGLPNKQISSILNISPLTAKNHLANVGSRTGWHRRETIGLVALLNGEVTMDDVRGLQTAASVHRASG